MAFALQKISIEVDAPVAPAPVTRRRVLVVDDSAAQRRLLVTLLGRWGYDVAEAESGALALDMLKTRTVDIIISDWMMPGMSGVEFCRAFRRSERRTYGYFVLLTSKGEKEDVALGLDSGADDFLTKPVNRNELRARLVAGERIVGMQAELRDKNDLLSDTLRELEETHAALDRDLLEARKFQKSLIPERLRDFDGGRVSLLFRPCGHVGGDFIGSFRVSETRIGLYSIDVSGHGVASALLSARIAGYLGGTSPDQNIAIRIDGNGLCTMRAPHETCARLNELMLDQLETDLYLTMVLADCDLRTGEVRFAQAGHPSPVVLRSGGRVEQPGEGGHPVGLLPGSNWTTISLRLNPGDRLLLLSDGITECPGPDGLDFGESGLDAFLTDHAHLTGPELLDSLNWELDRRSGLSDLPDDVSGVLLDFTGPCSTDQP